MPCLAKNGLSKQLYAIKDGFDILLLPWSKLLLHTLLNKNRASGNEVLSSDKKITIILKRSKKSARCGVREN